MTNSTIHRLGDAFYAAMLEVWQAEGRAIDVRCQLDPQQ